MTTRKRDALTDNVTCPACGKTVKILQNGVLQQHDRTPDAPADVEQKPEHCRWSGEPVDLIV